MSFAENVHYTVGILCRKVTSIWGIPPWCWWNFQQAGNLQSVVLSVAAIGLSTLKHRVCHGWLVVQVPVVNIWASVG